MYTAAILADLKPGRNPEAHFFLICLPIDHLKANVSAETHLAPDVTPADTQSNPRQQTNN